MDNDGTLKEGQSGSPAVRQEANWRNRTIWTRDNLHVLRGMNSGCVDLIYLDPPFNSNRTYSAPIGSKAAGAAFKDAWTFDDADRVYLALLQERDPTTFAIIEAARLAHGKGMAAYLGMMAQRLVEMRRVLKETGSIYLHCDDVAVHYLKMVMDCIFGSSLFRNEIIWKRSVPHNDSKGYGRVADRLLFYGSAINANAVRMPLDPSYVAKFYRHKDSRGTYRAGPLTTKGLSGGGYHYDFHGHEGPWRYPEDRIKELEADDRIHLPKKAGGVPSSKLYLHENKGSRRRMCGPTSRRYKDRRKSARVIPHRSRFGYWSGSSLPAVTKAIRCLTRSAGAPRPPSRQSGYSASGSESTYRRRRPNW